MLLIDYKKINDSLPLNIVVTNPFTKTSKKYSAIIDTGATNSVITQKVFKEMKLPKMDSVKVFGVNSEKIVASSLINITLSTGMIFEQCDVLVCDLDPDTDILLGMDIITQGDLLITNNNATKLSFAVPPFQKSMRLNES